MESNENQQEEAKGLLQGAGKDADVCYKTD
jgi:hypothetical protein